MSALLVFSPFRLDVDNERLWCGEEKIHLRPKAFAVLRHLINQQERLVSRDELVHAIWPDTKISDVVLRGCLREIRQALGDSVQTPRFIETVPRRGWRFVASLSTTTLPLTSEEESPAHTQPALRLQTSHPLVGRENELKQLQQYLEKAQRNEPQIVFISGEVGIGKTALLDAFLTQAATTARVWIARGQCVEQYGAGEPYLPILEALDRLCRESETKPMLPLFRRHAPMWLLQLPGVLDLTEGGLPPLALQGATQDRMLREMAGFLEALTIDRTLVLVLEDIHWSDASTLALITYLARRREAARLLIVGTYRPAEVIRRKHSLRSVVQELAQSGHCQELPLSSLSERAVSEYVTRRFPGKALPTTLGKIVHLYTEGNPLFVVNMVEHLIAQGVLVQQKGEWEVRGQLQQLQQRTPETLRHLIEGQLDRLNTEEQHLLEVGSVVGMEFSATVVAAALGEDLITTEACCATLARHHLFLRVAGTQADQERRLATRYRFLHSLYLDVIYERLPQAKRRQLHQRIGAYKEQEYGERAIAIAPELATHFKEGREYHRAVHYLGLAAQTAMQRQGPHEALTHLHQAQALLATLPESPELRKQLSDVQRALRHPVLSLANTKDRRDTGLTRATLRKIA